MELTEQRDARNYIDFPVDVLLICAMYDEYVQVLNVKEGIDKPWHEHIGPNGWIVADGRFATPSGIPLVIRATHACHMGREKVQACASRLIQAKPARCIAMSGICAGWRGKVALGDVIFADRLWSYDSGKGGTDENGRQWFLQDKLQYRPLDTWTLRMQHVSIPADATWLRGRPSLPFEYQEDWVLLRLLAGKDPCKHPKFKSDCPNWSDVLQRLWKRKWVEKPLLLTASGRERAEELKLLYSNTLPPLAAFRTHVAPMATGAAVTEDADIFPRLAEADRKILGLEMEASALGALGEDFGVPVLVAKGVSDYGDAFKDDRYRHFAARAAAECLIALLRSADDLIPGRNGNGATGHNDIPRPTTPSGDTAKLSVPTSLEKARVLLENLFADPPEGSDLRAACAEALPKERLNRLPRFMDNAHLLEWLLDRPESLLDTLTLLAEKAIIPEAFDARAALSAEYGLAGIPKRIQTQKSATTDPPALLVEIWPAAPPGNRCNVEARLFQGEGLGRKVYDRSGEHSFWINDPEQIAEFVDHLRGIIADRHIDKKRVVVEFALPLALLSHHVDQWADLSGKHLGTYLPVVVRSLDRLRNNGWWFDWLEHWAALRSGFDLSLDEANLKKRLHWPKDWDDMLDELKNGVCIVLDEAPDPLAERGSNILFHLAYNGAPLVLWARRKDGLADLKAEIEKHLLNKTLGQLPSILLGIREQLWKEKRKDAIGYHLSLLWDDPGHGLPPRQDDDDFLLAPT